MNAIKLSASLFRGWVTAPEGKAVLIADYGSTTEIRAVTPAWTEKPEACEIARRRVIHDPPS